MRKTLEGSPARVRKRPVDKFEDRRMQLADAALETLAEQGYARTGLRDIAERSDFTHGALHYYFHNKAELITYCVRRYKDRCIAQYDGLGLGSETAQEVLESFSGAVVSTMIEEAHMQRLWYDIRSQAMFESALAMDVAELDQNIQDVIFRVVVRYSELSEREPTLNSALTYALFDGLFMHAVMNHLAGKSSESDVRLGIEHLLDSVTRPI
ncbi:TetR/AcrR family transcriptional regulator [Rhodococcus marinonascens]|uniref:TetR/AcrR family transcriptional regulator n=1 Tax=Rhodococcus marinonascens TaxID=38311 RepID=UPI0009333440|nr:TetR/AcrR family transcriptional regulator [Rhodococcus marinonascens]